MNEKIIIKKTIDYVRGKLEGEGTGHDWWHVYRVWKMALKIAGKEKKADLLVIQLSALLHDIADWKFNEGDENIGPRVAKDWLEKLNVSEDVISEVSMIIKDMSFKGAGVKFNMKTLEGKIVQDADRLDALGAIGIARCFATSAKLGREIYNPEVRAKMHKSFEEYKNSKSTSINHFYEKLFLLKDLMNTETAKEIASEREKYMKEFLNRFYTEWEIKD